MSKCFKCSADVDDALEVCPVCGALLDSNNGAVPAAQPAVDASTQERLMAIFAYLGLLFLIPLFADNSSRFVRYHVNQGCVLFLCEVLIAILSTVLWILPGIGWILSLAIALPLYLVTVAFMVVGIVHAAGGESKMLPIIGTIQLIK